MNHNQEPIRRAAMLVAALDADAADALLDRLSAEQAGLVRRLLVEIDDVDPHEQRTVIQAFLSATAPPGQGVEPTVEFVAPEAPVPHAPTFGFLHEADVEDLRELLSGERPQTVAVVISHLPADRAAKVLATLATPLQADVMRRLASLHEADPDVLGDIEAGLQMRFRKRLVRGDRSAGVGAVQDILSEAAPPLRQTLLSAISRQDPRLAERLNRPTRPTFGFADLPRLSHDSLRLLFDSIDEEYAAVALAGAETDFAARLIAPLPRARIERLQAAIDSLGPTPLADIELAQDELTCVARELDTAGRLTWREVPVDRTSSDRTQSDRSSNDRAPRRTAAA